MATIRVRGEAVVFDFQSEDATDDDTPVVEDPAVLETLHGLEHDEIFSDYLSDGGDKTLANAGVSGGILRFEFDRQLGVLFGVTEYSAPRLLNTQELALLKDYTVGQWSDGIGENFTQARMDFGLAPQLVFLDKSAVTIEQRS